MEWLSDHVKSWIARFWFIRGVVLAFFTLHVAGGVVQLDRYEILRGVYAAIVGWDRVASGIGRLVGHLPFLPTLDHFAVNALLYSSIIGVPSAYATIRQEKKLSSTPPETDSPRSVLGAFIRGLTWPELIERINQRTLTRRIFLSLMAFMNIFIPGFLYYIIATDHVVTESHRDSLFAIASASFVLAQMFFASMLYLVIALTTIRGLAKGYFLALSFLATLVVLYWIGGPQLRDSVNEFSRTVIEAN